MCCFMMQANRNFVGIFVLYQTVHSSMMEDNNNQNQKHNMNIGRTICMHRNGRSSGMNVGRVALFAFLLALTPGPLFGAEPEKAQKSSPEFERMKSLTGTWKGKADMGQGPVEMTVEYRLVSGGSAIEERIFEGSPKEMITMYYDKKGKLALTHYCMLANQPGMLLKSSDARTLRFDFDPTCGLDASSEMHMHSLAITFENPDTI